MTGWLLALTLPPWAPWWIGVIGSLIAIVVAKQAFGGLGQNLFNPAMVARVALLMSFPLEMTTFIMPQPLLTTQAPGFMESLAITFGASTSPDAISSASILGHVRTELTKGSELAAILGADYGVAGLALGDVQGSLGETSAVLILLGGLFLLLKGVITWHIPVSLLGTLALLATVFNVVDPGHYPGAIYHLLSGAGMLGAFFIATDPVTSPVSARGQLVFGAGCGALIYVIRTWAGYPEGVAFAVMLMNACTPLIDHYMKPRIYGRDRRDEPLVYADDAEERT
jgi:electron transport complex protein RnfD